MYPFLEASNRDILQFVFLEGNPAEHLCSILGPQTASTLSNSMCQ